VVRARLEGLIGRKSAQLSAAIDSGQAAGRADRGGPVSGAQRPRFPSRSSRVISMCPTWRAVY
jgi:hypothetical protein